MKRTAFPALVMALIVLALSPASPAKTKKAPAKAASANFFLHDGDTVVFYGDSITDQQGYTQDIENYVVTRFPRMRVRFINSGWGADRVSGGGGGPIDVRLKRDVLPYHPTVVTILLGMNDGGYHPFDQPTFQTYADGMTHIVNELRASLPHVKIVLLTPTIFDDGSQPAGSSAYNQALEKYGDFLQTLRARPGVTVVNLNAPLVAATAQGRQSDPHFNLTMDHIHPNPAGHLIMAAALLRSWYAPAAVTTAANVAVAPRQPATFTLSPPWPVPDDAKQALSVSSLPGSLGGPKVYIYIGTTRGITAAQSKMLDADYVLVIDGQDVGTFSGQQLERGVDLSQFPSLALNRQAAEVAATNADRINQWHHFFKGDTGFGPATTGLAQPADAPTPAEVAALVAEDKKLDALRVQARAAAQPAAHTFRLRAVTAGR